MLDRETCLMDDLAVRLLSSNRSSMPQEPGDAATVRVHLLDLPNELLMLIVIHIHRSVEPHRGRKPAVLLWQGVCRRFHEIAGATGEVWACVTDIYNLELTSIAVKRSGLHPLTLDLGPPNRRSLSDWRRGMAILEPHHHRVQTIRVDYTGFNESEDNMSFMPPWHIPFLYGDWTSLESIEFSNYWFDSLFSKASFYREPPMSWRKLVLKDCSLEDPFHIFRVPLTCLHLERCDLHCGVLDFIALINNLPTLTRLVLVNTFGEAAFPEEVDILRPSAAIHLAHLKHLELDAPFKFVISIAIGLDVPDWCAVRMRTDTPGLDEGPISDLQNVLDAAFRSRLSRTFASLDPESNSKECHISFGKHDAHTEVSIELLLARSRQSEGRCFVLSLRPPTDSRTWPEQASLVRGILAWDVFQDVILLRGVRVPMAGAMWQQILSTPRTITCLQADVNVADLHTALAAMPNDGSVQRLCELILNGVKLKDDDYDGLLQWLACNGEQGSPAHKRLRIIGDSSICGQTIIDPCVIDCWRKESCDSIDML